MSPEEFNNICEEYDATPYDFAWDEGHPIFLMAQENDELKVKLEAAEKVIEAAGTVVLVQKSYARHEAIDKMTIALSNYKERGNE